MVEETSLNVAVDNEKFGVDESSLTIQALHVNPEQEKKLLRKLDIFIAPIMTIIFLTAYLDRSNIGNAASAGMTDDLGMTASELGSVFNYLSQCNT